MHVTKKSMTVTYRNIIFWQYYNRYFDCKYRLKVSIQNIVSQHVFITFIPRLIKMYFLMLSPISLQQTYSEQYIWTIKWQQKSQYRIVIHIASVPGDSQPFFLIIKLVPKCSPVYEIGSKLGCKWCDNAGRNQDGHCLWIINTAALLLPRLLCKWQENHENQFVGGSFSHFNTFPAGHLIYGINLHLIIACFPLQPIKQLWRATGCYLTIR